jgi:hypothetical protein
MNHRMHLLLPLICASLLASQPAESVVEISCNGDACNLFGTLDYNYILRNAGDTPVTVTEFYVATNDLDEASYSSFSMPAGFQVVIDTWENLNDLYGVTEQPTTGKFTDHGLIPDAEAVASQGAVLMTGSNFTLQLQPRLGPPRHGLGDRAPGRGERLRGVDRGRDGRALRDDGVQRGPRARRRADRHAGRGVDLGADQVTAAAVSRRVRSSIPRPRRPRIRLSRPRRACRESRRRRRDRSVRPR